MTRVWTRIAKALALGECVALISVMASQGSVPRGPGARILVRASGFSGTIGGGVLEHSALAAAQILLNQNGGPLLRVHALGPELGQCCGGRVTTLTEIFTPADSESVAELVRLEEASAFSTATLVTPTRVERAPLYRQPPAVPPGASVFVEHFGDDLTPLLLFGAGHVGRALVLALAPLPFHIRWIDGRADAFPAVLPGQIETAVSSDHGGEIAAAAPGSFVLIMTHSHPLDLDIAGHALRRDDLGYVGLIGSQTKRARFARRLRETGLAPDTLSRLVCPVGMPGITGKDPAIIAASVAAQLLLYAEDCAGRRVQPMSIEEAMTP